ncbi:MAG: hypothetical protein AB7F59_13985 [Bdellovibrionales bacterium]
MKNYFVTLAIFGFIFSAQAQEVSSTTSNSIDPQKQVGENNFRFFPFNLVTKSYHGAFERRISSQWALGLEGAWQSQFERISDYGNARERYIGLFAQYYLKQSMKGYFLEGGLNYATVEFSDFVTTSGVAQFAHFYLMPHLTINHRFVADSGLSFTIGSGAYLYLGDSVETRRVIGAYADSNSSGLITEKERDHYTFIPQLRVRADIGYTF